MWNYSPTVRNRHYGDRDCDDGGWDNPDLWAQEDELASPPIEPLTPPPQPSPPTPPPPPPPHTSSNKSRTPLMPKRSSLKSTIESHHGHQHPSQNKNVSFHSVIIYYFTRSQGFMCIPTEGGSTLGMCTNHFMSQELNVETHDELRRRIHREILLRFRHAKTRQRDYDSSSAESEDDFNENDYCDITDADLSLEKFTFLQPISVKNRRSLLRAAGIAKIDASEKRECKRIRDSRERTGCRCDGVCNPDTCECSRLGVNCHVDRESFPCGCSLSGCLNPSGRLEFDGKKVRTHFIDTLIRLGFESNLKSKDFNLLKERQNCEVSSRGEIQPVNMNNQTNGLLGITSGLIAFDQQTHEESNVEVESIEDMPETSYTLYEYELSELNQNGVPILGSPPVELENHNYVRRHVNGLTMPSSIPQLAIINNPIPAQLPSAQQGDPSIDLQSTNNNVASIVQATRLDHPYINIVGTYTDAHGRHISIGQTSFAGDCNNCDTITMNPSSSNFGTYVDHHHILNCNNDQRYCAAAQSLCDHHYFTNSNKKIMFVNNNHLNAQHLDEYGKHIPSRDGE